MSKSIRVHITIDPDLFPEVYEDQNRLRQKKGKVNGSRLLHLATLGLALSKTGNVPSMAITPSPIQAEPIVTTAGDSNSGLIQTNQSAALPEVIHLTEDDMDIESTMNGDFV